MADNVTANAGSGGSVFATDDVSGVHYPITKITIGAFDSAGTLLSGGNGTTDAGTLRVTISSDSTGVLSIDDNGGAITVDNGGTFAVQEDGAALTALQLIDDVVYADDADWTDGTSKHALIGGLYQSSPQSITDGDVGPLQVTANGYLIVSVNGTVAVSNSDLTTIAGDTTSIDGKITACDTGAVVISSGTVATTNAGTFAVQESGSALTALQLLDDTILADDAAFTLNSSKVSMAGAIRDDSLSTLTAIEGDAVPLRVSSTGALHVTGAGGGTQYTFGTDTFTEATSVGTLMGVVRYDAGGSLVNTDNEITSLQVDSNGALRVTGGGGGTEYNEDVATPATITGTATLMERDDALATVTPIEGDWIAFRGTAEGALWTQDFNSDAILADTTTIAGAVSGTEMQVDVVGSLPAGTNAIGKLAANSGVDIGDVDVTSVIPGTGATNLGKAEDAVHASGDTGVMALGVRKATPANLSGTDGDYEPFQVSAGRLWVNASNNGTFAVQAAGAVAHDDADSGNPLKIGAKVETSTSGATLAADGDRTNIYADADGAVLARTNHPLADLISDNASDTGGTSTAFTGGAAAPGAGIKLYITAITIYNSSATDGYVDLRDGTAGSVKWTAPAPAAGGSVITNGGHPLFALTANTALAYDVSGALSTVYISVSGFKSKV